ncbi:MAG: hypothetical protein MJ241_04605 [Bacilli bacterium]|nr:hypothetical protein [Bacilli bacterium]
MKKYLPILTLVLLFSLTGCGTSSNTESKGNDEEESYVPQTDLEKAFSELKKNNFTMDFTDSIANFDNVERHQKYYYTDYALQSDGDLGFAGIAQNDEVVFKYNIVDDSIVPGLPLINYNTGLRYESMFDYTYGFDKLKISELPKEKDEKGWYKYEFGKSRNNDPIMLSVVCHLSIGSFPPKELKFKTVKGMVIAEGVILEYSHNNTRDTFTTTIYDIGETDIPLIQDYLWSGKSSLTPLDNRFYKFFTPYLSSYNYTIDLDARGLGYDIKIEEKFTENAVMNSWNTGKKSGILMSQGVAHQFSINRDGKLGIDYTLTNSDNEFYYSLYGGPVGYNLTDLSFSTLVGYCDEKRDNWYYITDSEFLYIMSYIVYNEIYDENYCDKMTIEVLDFETGEFNAYMEYYNRLTKARLGTYNVHFYGRGKTEIPEVDEYLYRGDPASKQDKSALSNVLNRWRGGNYSSDSLSESGLAKIYNTNDYYYEVVYGNENLNYGLLKRDDGAYEFNLFNNIMTVDETVAKDIKIPGVGSFYKNPNDDSGYISHFSDELYNLNNYEAAKSPNGDDYWRITNLELSTSLFNYLYQLPTNLLPNGTGIMVYDNGEASKLTIISNYISKNGSYTGYLYITFYDIGTTSHPVIENYINSK